MQVLEEGKNPASSLVPRRPGDFITYLATEWKCAKMMPKILAISERHGFEGEVGQNLECSKSV